MDKPAFGDHGLLGASAFWRFVLAIVLVIGAGLAGIFIMAVLLGVLGFQSALDALFDGRLDTRSFSEQLVGVGFLLWGVIAFLPPARIILPWLHRRPWRSFISAAPRFRWPLAGLSFAIIVGLLLVALGLQLLSAPDLLAVRFGGVRLLWLAILAAVLVPLQVLTEEVLFRGYLLQLAGRFTSRVIVRLGVPAVLFMLAHFDNPEIDDGGVWVIANYLLAGLYLGWLAIKADGLEAAIGTHLGVNLFVMLVQSPATSVFPVDAIVTELSTDYRAGVFGGALVYGLHYVLLFKRTAVLGLWRRVLSATGYNNNRSIER